MMWFLIIQKIINRKCNKIIRARQFFICRLQEKIQKWLLIMFYYVSLIKMYYNDSNALESVVS
jgi:hypothetical protein